MELDQTDIHVPVLPVWQRSDTSTKCLPLHTSLPKVVMVAQSAPSSISFMPLTLTWQHSKLLTSRIWSSRVEFVSLSEECDVYDNSERSPLTKIQPDNATLAADADEPECIDFLNRSSNSRKTQKYELGETLSKFALDTNLSKWPCVTLPREAYTELLAVQNSDGSFGWPEAMLERMGPQQRSLVNAWNGAETDDTISTCLALAFLRRCFSWKHRAWRLVEKKSLAWLRERLAASSDGSPADPEQLVARTNLLIVQRLITITAFTD